MKEGVRGREALSHISPNITRFNIVKSLASRYSVIDVGLTELRNQFMCAFWFFESIFFFSSLLILNCLYLIDNP